MVFRFRQLGVCGPYDADAEGLPGHFESPCANENHAYAFVSEPWVDMYVSSVVKSNSAKAAEAKFSTSLATLVFGPLPKHRDADQKMNMC